MTEKATFAAGCFWGVEASFRRVRGVTAARVGYTGGRTHAPTYEDVCTGTTGHAEAVELEFDPAVVSFDRLLEIFWSIHDPTSLNRQGPDRGSQYRSAVFFHDERQKDAATGSMERLETSGRTGGVKVVTEIVPAGPFYEAEEYHQRYLERNSGSGCRTH